MLDSVLVVTSISSLGTLWSKPKELMAPSYSPIGFLRLHQPTWLSSSSSLRRICGILPAQFVRITKKMVILRCRRHILPFPSLADWYSIVGRVFGLFRVILQSPYSLAGGLPSGFCMCWFLSLAGLLYISSLSYVGMVTQLLVGFVTIPKISYTGTHIRK